MINEPMVEHKLITYFVNAEPQETDQHELTVRTILSKAGLVPPENYELERDDGHHIFGSLDEEVPLHQGERFTALFEGPTPTSGAEAYDE